jgi:uncharacterized protein
MFRFILIIVIWFLLDLYVFQALKTVLPATKSWFTTVSLWSYWLVDVLIIASITILIFSGKMSHGPHGVNTLLMGGIILSLVPKLFIFPFLLVEDVTRFFQALFAYGQHLFGVVREKGSFFPDRRKFVSQIALGIAAIPFIGIIYGVLKGKYEYRVHQVDVPIPNLPDAFNGFTITQLSDIHVGSFDNPEAVQAGIDLANSLNSDLLVFTGDLVNNLAAEMKPWMEHFSQLKAPHGVFSILGNHDYGDYAQWSSEEDKQANFEDLKAVHRDLGFNLLLNEHTHIEKDGQKICLIGIENWGKRGFVKHGDLNKAIQDVPHDSVKILLSHDPSHWEAQTIKHEKHIHLTLSGHTHGMQFGIEIPGIKWSPIKYLYPQWAGLYHEKGKYLYVNRGFGFLGFPGRVGILPEITQITLVKG